MITGQMSMGDGHEQHLSVSATRCSHHVETALALVDAEHTESHSAAAERQLSGCTAGYNLYCYSCFHILKLVSQLHSVLSDRDAVSEGQPRQGTNTTAWPIDVKKLTACTGVDVILRERK